MPRTDLLLCDPRLVAAERRLGRALVKAAVGRAQQRAREGQIAPGQVADAAVAELLASAASLSAVINATGVLVHTNLGRAPLSAAAVEAIAAAAGNCDVEFDLASGARARRGTGALGALARAVPAAEAVAVVNNNAAALVLAATALARPDRVEIVVSRGELIEIGNRFRLPDLLASTGARLREVGTTNRTTAADYAEATGPRTAFVAYKVHPSNFRIEGFTSAVAVPELAELAEVPRHPCRVRHRLRPARPAPAAARRAQRGRRAAGRRGAGHRERRQAARRPGPACCSAGPTWCTGSPAIPWPGHCGWTSSPSPPWRPPSPDRYLRLPARRPPTPPSLSIGPNGPGRPGEDARARRVASRAAVGGGGAPGVPLPRGDQLPESLGVPLRAVLAVRASRCPPWWASSWRPGAAAARSVDPWYLQLDEGPLVAAILAAAQG